MIRINHYDSVLSLKRFLRIVLILNKRDLFVKSKFSDLIPSLIELMGDEDRDHGEKKEKRDEEEGIIIRVRYVLGFSNEVRSSKQADARTGRDDAKS